MKKLTMGMLAHVDAGKTTLSEGLLYRSGEIRKLGRVDHGDSYLDGNTVERNRGITVFSKQARFQAGDTEVTLLDTPGHVDFSAEMERVLSVIDMGVLILSAPDGIQSHTETLWKLLQQRNIPVLVFVNKMDLAVREKETIVQELTDAFGTGFVDFSRNRQGEDFIDDVTLALPELMDQVLMGQDITDSELANAVQQRRLYPCIFGSALKMEGLDVLAECLDRYTKEPDYDDAFGAKVFKVSRDERGERLAFIRLTGGKLAVRTTLHGTDSEGEAWEEKVNQIRFYSGMKYRTADEVEAGMVCAVTGLSKVIPGDVLGSADPDRREILEPFMTYTVEIPEGMDSHQVLRHFRELEEEDPKLYVNWSNETKQISIRLMGQIQLEVIQAMLEDRYGYCVTFGTGKIIYQETIGNMVEGVGHFEPLRHYAEVHLILEPGERGSGVVYNSTLSEDILLRNWQRLILGNLEQKEHRGVLIGAPLTDVKITLAAGKAHEKHTSGGDFREASYRAVRNGLMKAESILLEPWFTFRIEVPTPYVGRVMTDIQQMGGRLGNLEQYDDRSVLPGEAPAGELIDYPLTLTSFTGGQGRIHCTLKGYDICHNTEEVLANSNYKPERDLDNPADSVFVSHGSTSIVPWNEVEEHMHLPSALRSNRPEESVVDTRRENLRRAIATDEELRAIFERTYGKSKKVLHRGPIERRTKADEISPESQARNLEIREKHQKKKSNGGEVLPELLIVDGYNLINCSEELRALANNDLGAARQQLIDRLVNYQGYMNCELILVFDAYLVPYGKGSRESQHGVEVVFTREEEPADILIGKMVDEVRGDRNVRVVSSDALVQQNALGHDAARISSREFLDELEQVDREIRNILDEL
jgi:ribosomal protection tetracycline resistance protein